MLILALAYDLNFSKHDNIITFEYIYNIEILLKLITNLITKRVILEAELLRII